MKLSTLSVFSLTLTLAACGELPSNAELAADAARQPSTLDRVSLARQSLLLSDRLWSELAARTGRDGYVALFADDIAYTDGDRLVRGR